MDQTAYERYKWTQQQLDTDAEYLHLLVKFQEAQADFRAAMETLTPEHRQNVTEYLGLLGELQDRSVQIACMAP